MKKAKFLLGAAVIAGSLSLASCGGIDGEKAADEYCACIEKEGEEKTKCVDAWVETYKGARGSEEEGEKMGTKMAECNGLAAVEDLLRLAE